MKIDSALYPSYRGIDSSPFDNCPTHKWDKYLILADEQRIALKGYGFGATRGTSTIKIMYKKTVLPSSIIEYEDWSDTEASFYLNLAGRDTLKNISLKFIIVKDGVEKFKTVKALGATGMQYGTNVCNINRIRKKNGKSMSDWQTGTYTDVSSSYVPALGDVLQRASGEKGVVYEIINTPDTKGRIKVKVQTINANCKSGSKKGTWKFKDTFLPKTSEATSGTWVKYFH